MASLAQYLLSRVSQECAETAQAFSKLFDYGLYHRHPVTKELAISKASQEVNDILGTIDLLQEVGVELFGIGNPEKREAKKLKIFRNMQLSIDERCLILSNAELEKLNAMFPDEKPLKQAPPAELVDVEEIIRTLHMNHPQLFARDIHLDMLLEIARVKNVRLSSDAPILSRDEARAHLTTTWQPQVDSVNSGDALVRAATEHAAVICAPLEASLAKNQESQNGTVPHEEGTIGTVKTDGGIVTTL